jgi:hypothetical protein
MAGSSNQSVYSVGVTLLAVVAGATATLVVPPKGVNSLAIKYASGGSLAIVPAIGSSGVPLGWQLTSTPDLIDGPASFFLNAGGATAVAAILFKFSSGGQSGVP